jgi:hypothetical protein
MGGFYLKVVKTKEGKFFLDTNKMCLISCKNGKKIKLNMWELSYYKQININNKKRGHINRG